MSARVRHRRAHVERPRLATYPTGNSPNKAMQAFSATYGCMTLCGRSWTGIGNGDDGTGTTLPAVAGPRRHGLGRPTRRWYVMSCEVAPSKFPSPPNVIV